MLLLDGPPAAPTGCGLRSAGLRIRLHKYISFQSGLINASDLFWGRSAFTNLKVCLSCFDFTAKLDRKWCICCLRGEGVLNAINGQIKWMFILPASLGRTFRLINERIPFLFLCAPIHCKLLNGLKLTPDSTIRDFCWDNFHRGPLKMFWCGFSCETGVILWMCSVGQKCRGNYMWEKRREKRFQFEF